MLQPATKALAQVLAGRAGASGQLGHARTMLAQAERMIAERAHNRLTPAEREEFFEQLARLKLTLSDADAEAEVQAVEQDAPRVQMPPVAHERLKEMALALSVPERPGPTQGSAASTPKPASETVGEMVAREAAAQVAKPTEAVKHDGASGNDAPADGSADRGAAAVGGRDRLVLPKASADRVAQAVAFGSATRRRTRASTRGAAAAAAQEENAATTPAPVGPTAASARSADPVDAEPRPAPTRFKVGVRARHGGQPPDHDAGSVETSDTPGVESGPSPASDAQPQDAAQARSDNGAVDATPSQPKTSRRGRKPKHRGLPEGWVIDDDGFVVPGAD